MREHPQYAMWKSRLDIEQSVARDRAARRAERDGAQAGLLEAWAGYRAHWQAGLTRAPPPPWWHLRAWLRLLHRSWHPH